LYRTTIKQQLLRKCRFPGIGMTDNGKGSSPVDFFYVTHLGLKN